MKSRLGYLVKPKKELMDHLKLKGSDLGEYFSENYTVITDELEYDEFFESWKKQIITSAKYHFIKDTILDLDLPKEVLSNIFGKFKNDEEFFNLWWYLEETDISVMPTNWQRT